MGRQRLWDQPCAAALPSAARPSGTSPVAKRVVKSYVYGSYSQGAATITDQTAEELVSFALAPRPTYVAAASGRYDGVWKATFDCSGFKDVPPRTFDSRVVVAGGEFVLEDGIPGQPGSHRASGRPTDNGDIRLVGTGVNSREPYRGMVFDIQFEGRLVGDRIELSGVRGSRTCTGTIARTGG